MINISWEIFPFCVSCGSILWKVFYYSSPRFTFLKIFCYKAKFILSKLNQTSDFFEGRHLDAWKSCVHLFEVDPVPRHLLDAFALVVLHQVCQRVKHLWSSHCVPVILKRQTRHPDKHMYRGRARDGGAPHSGKMNWEEMLSAVGVWQELHCCDL